MRDIRYIVIHEAACPSYKPDGSEFTITDIDKWHHERDFHRIGTFALSWHPELKAVGYHYVIGRGGQIWPGRHEDEVPAAVKGFNTMSLNICLIGQNGNFSTARWQALSELLNNLTAKYPRGEVAGHCDKRFNSGKTCPGFDVKAWWSGQK